MRIIPGRAAFSLPLLLITARSPEIDQDGLAYRDGFVLVADREGIGRVPHVSGALRAGRAEQPKITDAPPEERKPVLAAYGQEIGVIAGHCFLWRSLRTSHPDWRLAAFVPHT